MLYRLVGEAFEGRVVVLQKADCRICLYQGFLDPPEPQPIFWQGDVEAIAKDLTGKGIVFEKGPSRDDGDGTSALLKDPDGRPIFFVNVPGVTRLGSD